MKTKAIQKTAETAGLTLAGSIAGYKAMGVVPGKFGPMAVLGAGAVGHVMSTNQLLKHVSLGAVIIGAIGTMNQLSQADESGIQKGYQKALASVAPQLTLPVNGLAELEYDDYDFEPLQGAEDEVAALLEGGDFDEYDEYDELDGLMGDEDDVAQSLMGY